MTTMASTPVNSTNRVPQVDWEFWLVKLMAVTVGETAADYIIFQMHMGLPKTSLIMSGLLAVVLAVQFAQKRYVPWAYWTAVVMVSVVGTLITDSLVDTYNIPLEVTTAVFVAALIAIFAVWYWSERTLSIHTIHTTRREAFYWLAILLTFALGTAAGDMIAEGLGLGYLLTGLMFAGIIAAITAAYHFADLNGIVAFWLAYILTRPMGASFGDLLAQSHAAGGLGLGTTITSVVFLAVIVALIGYMSVSRQHRLRRLA